MILDPMYNLIANLSKRGRSAEEIARRVNKPVGWVVEVLDEPAVKEFLGGSDVPDEDVDEVEIWSDEKKAYERERMAPLRYRTWESILRDPEANDTAKLKVIEQMMKYDQDLVVKDDGSDERVSTFTFDQRSKELLGAWIDMMRAADVDR